MGRNVRALVAVAATLLASRALAASERGKWPPLPEGTKVVLLITGADYGNYFPKGCNGRFGGAIYRLNFDRWLAAQAPGVQRIWIATGDNGPGEAPPLFSLSDMYGVLGRVGYAFSGVGWTELRILGAADLADVARQAPFPVLSSNLLVHETGKTMLPGSQVLDIAGARVLFVAVGPEFPDRIWGGPRVGTVYSVPPAQGVREELARRRGAADRVVLVAAVSEWDAAAVLKEVPGIDFAIVAPNDRGALKPVVVEGVPTLMLAPEGRFLGRIAFGAGGVILEARSIPVLGDFPIDPLTGEVVAAAPETSPETPAPPK